MKNLKSLLLVMATMMTANADVNNFTINIDGNAIVEVFATDENEDKNIARQLARSCGDENFEMAVQFRVKPFAIDKGKIEEDIEDALKKSLKELLFSTNANGQTALDILNRQVKETGNSDCILLQEIFYVLAQDVLRIEHQK